MKKYGYSGRSTWLSPILLLCILAILVSACGPAETVIVVETVEVQVEVEGKEIVVTATPEPIEEPGKFGGIMRGMCVSPVTSLDPAYSKLGICDRISYRALYDFFLDMSPTGDVISDIVTWEESADHLTFTFHLIRDDIMFHDGTILDADAIKVTIDRLRDPESESPMAGLMGAIKEVNIIDPTTVEMVLDQPDVGLLSAMTTEVGMPIVSPTALEKYGEEDFRFNGVGSGPFSLVSWSPGDVAIFERNESYWRKDEEGNSLPYLDGFELYGVDDETVRLMNLASGEMHVDERIRPENISIVEDDPNLIAYDTNTAVPYVLTFNMCKPRFDNLLLRRAVQVGIDDDALIDAITFGTGYTDSWTVPRGVWYHPKVENPPYDPEKAKELLADAGYPDGLDVVLHHISRPTDAQVAQILQAQLAEININVEIVSLERTAWLDIWLKVPCENTDGEMAILQHDVVIGDPGAKKFFLDPNGIVNFAQWTNPEVWPLVEAQGAEYDQEKRAELWERIYVLNVEDVAYIWLGHSPVFAATNKCVHNLELLPVNAWDIHSTWIDSSCR